MAQEAQHSTELIFVTHDDCEPWEQNPRSNASEMDQDMQELIASVSANGVRQSLSVRLHPETPGRYQIAAGARRWYALGHAISAGARSPDDPLPVRILTLDTFDMLACALEENLQRKPMTCLEEAEAYLELAQHGHRGDRVTATIAERVGKSQRHIQTYIALARDLSPVAKEALREGRIKIAHAKVLTGIPAEEQERFIADQVGANPLRADRRVLKALLRPGSGHDMDQTAPETSRRSGSSSPSRHPTARRAKDPVRRHAEGLRAAAIYQAFTSHPDIALRIAALDLIDQLGPSKPDLNQMKDAEALLALPTPDERWKRISGFSAAKLRKLLVQLLGAIIAPKLASLGRIPSLLGPACQALPLGEAATDHLDEGFLCRYPKAQLLDLALASGAFSAEQRSELEKRTPRELRTAILESKTRNPDWLPPELRFDWKHDDAQEPTIEDSNEIST